MRLIIAEKPSVAKAIQDFLPSGSGARVLACRGHLLAPANPETYDAKYLKWNLAHLPIETGDRWILQPRADAGRELNAIGEALRSGSVTEVVHAGDPDPEGQLIVDEVLEHFGWRGRTSRVLPNALDEDTIRRAFDDIAPNAQFQNISNSAKARQMSDWIVGMNLSRAVTKALSVKATIPIGRVQTPTLAMIVRRYREIVGFVEQTFYAVDGGFRTRSGQKFTLRWEPDPRITDRAQAERLASAMVGQIKKLQVEKSTETKHAPMPFDLNGYQTVAEIVYGWDMETSLRALQAAYDAKFVSYPRTDCRYMPESQARDAIPIAKTVLAAFGLDPGLAQGMAPAKHVYNDKKVEEHHGLAPTRKVPGSDQSEEIRRAWAIVAWRFLASLMPAAKVDVQRITAVLDGEGDYEAAAFGAKFSKVTNREASWLAMDAMRNALLKTNARIKEDEDEDESAAEPPQVADGDDARLDRFALHEGKTTPPKPFTQTSLANEMAAAAKYVTDPEQKKRLKESKGIGTSATRTRIIGTLFERGFIRMKGKTIVPTDLGIQTIDALPRAMTDVAITAHWEEALRLIRKGEYSMDEFVTRSNRMVEKQIKQILALRDHGIRITAEKPADAARPKEESPEGSPSKRKAASRQKRSGGGANSAGARRPQRKGTQQPPAGSHRRG